VDVKEHHWKNKAVCCRNWLQKWQTGCSIRGGCLWCAIGSKTQHLSFYI